MKADPASETVLFDFGSGTNVSWQIVNDNVMGGLSTSSFRITNGAAVFQGDVSLENNGGFASVRSVPGRHTSGNDVDSFVIRVRGDGRRYKLTARTNENFDGVNYQCAFATQAGNWQEHRLLLEDFVPSYRGRVLEDKPPLSAAQLTSIGFLISEKQKGPFRLEIAWIKLAQSGQK